MVAVAVGRDSSEARIDEAGDFGLNVAEAMVDNSRPTCTPRKTTSEPGCSPCIALGEHAAHELVVPGKVSIGLADQRDRSDHQHHQHQQADSDPKKSLHPTNLAERVHATEQDPAT